MVNPASHGDKIKARILATGIDLWRVDPRKVTARGIGAALDMTHSAILYHFGTSDALRGAVASEAVRIGCRVIVPQLIVANHAAAAGIDPERRKAYLAGC